MPFIVTQQPKPTVRITAPQKQIAEAGEQFTLNAPQGFAGYIWANQTQQLGTYDSLVIDTAGTYYLAVVDQYGCSATDSIVIVQSLPIPDVALGLEDLHGFPGDKVTLHLKMLSSHRLDSSGATEYRAYLRFNKSLLAPVDNFASTYNTRERMIEITGTRNDSIGVLGRPIDFMVELGDSDVTMITLDSLIWTNGKPVRTTLSNGSFHLDGICPAGGNRLFSSDGYFGIKAMAPNPTGGDLGLDYQLLEHGRASMKVIDAIGRIAYTVFDQEVTPGAYHSSLDLHHLPAGVYTLVLQSATQREVRKIEVYR
jgi:hypothetical protein